MLRKVVHIDEVRCDGCGRCLPSCAEGAISLAGGKARLADVRCDGLGACLGDCPQGAISLVEREAIAFDPAAVPHPAASAAPPGCPGSAPTSRPRRGLAVVAEPASSPSLRGGVGALGNWPVQLPLVPPHAPFLRGAELLVAADCVPLACPSFHSELLAGRAVVVGCPKLDDLPSHLERLTRILAREDGPVRVTVARMEVPCCAALATAARQAAEASGRGVPVEEVVVGVDGAVHACHDTAADTRWRAR